MLFKLSGLDSSLHWDFWYYVCTYAQWGEKISEGAFLFLNISLNIGQWEIKETYRENIDAYKEIPVFFWNLLFCLYLGILPLLFYLNGEVSKKGFNFSFPFERKGNWISVNAFLYFNSKICKRSLKKVPIGKKITKMKKKNHQTIHFHEILAMPFHCRAVQVCLETMVP